MLRRYFFLIAVLFIFSCKKEKVEDQTPTETADTTIPVITLNSPTASSVYHNGDTLFITGTVTDNDLHDATLEIKDDTTAQVYFSASPYVHGLNTATINYSWIVNVTHNASATLTVNYSDHAPNVGLKLVNVILLL